MERDPICRHDPPLLYIPFLSFSVSLHILPSLYLSIFSMSLLSVLILSLSSLCTSIRSLRSSTSFYMATQRPDDHNVNELDAKRKRGDASGAKRQEISKRET